MTTETVMSREELIAAFDFYQKAAATTAHPYEKAIAALDPGVEAPQLRAMLNVFYPAVGLGEAGEAQNKIKKILRDGNGVITDERREQISKELGGLLWYVAETARKCGIRLGDVASGNLSELASRSKRGVLHGDGDNR